MKTILKLILLAVTCVAAVPVSAVTFDEAVTEFKTSVEKQRWVFPDASGRKEEFYGVDLLYLISNRDKFKQTVDRLRGKQVYMTKRVNVYKDALIELEKKMDQVTPTPATKKFRLFAVRPMIEMFTVISENPTASDERWREAAKEFCWYLDQQKTITLK